MIFQATSGKSWRKFGLGQASVIANHISLFPVSPIIACLLNIYCPPTIYRSSCLLIFFAFLTARAAVSLVTAMLTIAIGWHLYQNSGDPFDLALVGLMQIIPIFLFFFVTGWATDSLPRKALLIICTITEAVILIGITMAMLVDDLNLTVIFCATICAWRRQSILHSSPASHHSQYRSTCNAIACGRA